ncbi:MAG: hypothetical protein Kow0059_05640 [Candidatus Sumerlaeia bacterium]
MLVPIAHASQLNYIVFDLETTGLDPACDGITQLAAVRVRRGRILGEADVVAQLRRNPNATVTDRSDYFCSLVQPIRPIPPELERLTGITNEMVKNAPAEADVIAAFLAFSDGGVLTAHNGLTFDVPFVRAACGRCGLQAPSDTCLDTLRLCRRIDLACHDVKYDLGEVLRRHQIPMEPEFALHNALTDALFTARLLLKFLRILSERESDGIYIL